MNTTPNAWVLFDKEEGKYLTTGKTVFYGHSANPAEAHMYFSEKVVTQRSQILLDSFEELKKHYAKKKCSLQIVPLVVAPQQFIDVQHDPKVRKEGYAVHVRLVTYRKDNVYEGFWMKPKWSTIEDCELGNRSLTADCQKATIWQRCDTAQDWAVALEKALRARKSNPHSHMLSFKVKVELVK